LWIHPFLCQTKKIFFVFERIIIAIWKGTLLLLEFFEFSEMI
jgi:hypothetical protein